MKKSLVSNKILITALLIILIAIAFFLDVFEVFKWTHHLAVVPGIGHVFEEPEANKGINEISDEKTLLELEIENLNVELIEVRRDLNEVLNKKNNLLNEMTLLENEHQRILEENEQLNNRSQSYKDLARYYAEIRPENVVEIFNQNFAQEDIVGILREMNTDEVARILSAMEPRKAAEITNLMLP